MTQEGQIDDKLHWYKDAIIYELHIKAFRDANCDGIGDFEGLMEKLEYLQNLGVTAIWLLPFYPSPLKDDGYDIADYYSINTSYGTIAQFKQLLREAHRRNLKVITELVINHTSDQHPWFQKARRAPKGSPERNFYVWTDDPRQYADARIIFQDFEKSNWTWDAVAEQYYWHRFFFHQPDLNYDNPAVQDEVFKIIDFWCSMGVDGFRLDAVPYLFERENTNCENLPETHVFLKRLRKHMDEKYPGTMMLAEANMWPEDSVSYFGNGDECHMNYHFPIMPRIFMALQMEDSYPIIDIIDQTPPIPPTCQWGIFLRNHDELTLEMVTDEERDYMYKVYVKDPKARINLGIRHRLAPLMDNDRRKIILLNYLLFSLPGTPVIYYGDEIGMGDNYYLGDRDGVRTPMQWSQEKNAGFSETNPQKLYLPVILDPLYHYDYINVELQNNNTSSLLWAMKRLISTRKKYRAFGRGDMKFATTNNAKVMAFTRSYEDEIVLVVVNLSRYSQPVEIDLPDFKGYSPVEVFSYNEFPAIKADNPYFLTLAPYECLWFTLNQHPAAMNGQTLYTLEMNEWDGALTADIIDELATDVLPGYLQKMRWYGGKARSIHNINIVSYAAIQAEKERVILLLIEVVYKSGLPDTYQLPVAFMAGESDIKTTAPNAVLCDAIVNGEQGIIYDAIYSEAYRQYMLQRIAANEATTVPDRESLAFTGNNKVTEYLQAQEKVKSKILSAEQSNSAIVYDNAFFLKVYRKVDYALNPDVEITRFLTEETGFTHLPAYLGDMEWNSGKGKMVLAMMQEMIEKNTDGWSYTLDRLNAYNEKILADPKLADSIPPITGSLSEPVAYDNLPIILKDLLDTTVEEKIRLLGIRTGEMHLALASRNDIPDFKPEEFSLHYQRSLYSSFQSQIRKTYSSLVKNVKNLPKHLQPEAQEIVDMKDALQERFKAIYRRKMDIIKTRVHGDYHLGQTLFTGKDIIILDFEGEPAASYSERRLKKSVVKDVAGMIRSFHYAAYGSLFLSNKTRKEDIDKLIPFAELWQHYMSNFYLKAYLQTVQGSRLVPADKDDMKILLEAYILEKAVYELNYELNNRPDWVIIPIRGIKAIMK